MQSPYTLWANKIWSFQADGLYIQGQQYHWESPKCGPYIQVVFTSKVATAIIMDYCKKTQVVQRDINMVCCNRLIWYTRQYSNLKTRNGENVNTISTYNSLKAKTLTIQLYYTSYQTHTDTTWQASDWFPRNVGTRLSHQLSKQYQSFNFQTHKEGNTSFVEGMHIVPNIILISGWLPWKAVPTMTSTPSKHT